MKNGTIKFKGDDDWLVVDLYRFLHYLNVFYNRLYVLEKYSNSDNLMFNSEYPILKKYLDNSLNYIAKGNELSVSSIKLQSPFEIKVNGLSDIIKEIREFYKDKTYRIKLDKKEKELAIEERQIAVEEKKVDLKIKQLELVEKKISFLKRNGYTDEQCNEIIKTLINPANKMLKSGEKNNVQIAHDN